MLLFVCPFIATPLKYHWFPEVAEEMSVTLDPSQIVVELFAEIIGVAGVGFTVTLITPELALHPELFVIVTP